MTDAIVVRNVSKSFGTKLAVRDLDLVVPRSLLYGFIGPNGAGKTTTIRMVMSILFPDRGEISVLGRGSALEAKDRIGYLPEERGVYRKMKVGAFLSYMARLKGAASAGLRAKVRGWLERIELADVETKRCEELSKGMQQKVQFVASVIHEPELLILDEPFSGLDPINMRLLRDLFLEQHRRGVTIIFSTHVMAQAEQLCDHIVMINNGKKVLDDSLRAIRASHDPRSILFEPLEADSSPESLTGIPGVEGVAAADGRWEIALRDGAAAPDVMRAIVQHSAPARIELHRPTLEDIFVETVTRDGAVTRTETERLRAALREDATAPQGG